MYSWRFKNICTLCVLLVASKVFFGSLIRFTRRGKASLLKYKPLTAFLNKIMIPSADIQRRIVELEVEHRDLDAVIDLLTHDVLRDELQLRRLKKRKLQLKDHITLLKMQLIPDIPA